MNQKFLVLILFFLFLFNLAFAEISNPSFEVYSNEYNTYALSWTDNSNLEMCNNGCGAGCFSPPIIPTALRTGVADANDGSYIMRGSFNPSPSDTEYYAVTSDLNYADIPVGTKICISGRTSEERTNYFHFAYYDPDFNKVCWVSSQDFFGSTGATNDGQWTEHCKFFNGNTDHGYFTLVGRRSIGSPSFYFDFDNVIMPLPLTINILNYTTTKILVGESLNFKIKVLRTDTNQFVSDANVELISNDFNAIMLYNTSTGYYETTHIFNENNIGSYDFNVVVYDLNNIDANLLNNNKLFSVLVFSPSDFIDQISNLTESTEYFISSTAIKTIMSISDVDTDAIFLFNGKQDYAGINFDLNIIVRSSLSSLNRFVVYTANEQEYLSGIWNFNDTITFGSTIYNGLQRIWIDGNEFYEYSFQDFSIAGNGKKYYKLKLIEPFKSWNSLHTDLQNDWDIQFLPSYTVSNNHYRDYFSISQFNEMRNQFKTKIPDINSNTSFNKFLLLFNGSVASGSFNEFIGQHYDINNSDNVQSVSISTTEKTFVVPVGADYPLMKGNNSNYIQLMNSDYALIERGFFLEPIDVLNSDYSIIERILIDDTNGFVINEGTPFRIQSKLYNKNGNLSYLEGKVYFNSVSANNQVAYFKKDLNNLAIDEIYSLDWLVDGIIDLNGNSARDFVVVLRAVNKENDWFEIQTENFKLRQYPNSTADLTLNAFLSNKKVGEHLSGAIDLKISSPNTLRALKFYVYRIEDGINSGYIKTFYKNKDFVCNGFDCSFNFELLDQVFDGAGVWFFSVSALLTTQLEDTNNNLTTKTYSFYVNYISFDTARILQVIERNPDFNYTTTEQIPLVLQLRDSDNENLKDRLKINLFISDCDQNQSVAVGTCDNIQDINYSPDSFLYDVSSGYNYYFFRRVFIDEDGSLLNNLHFYRFTADISDIKGTHEGHTQVVLTRRCANDSYTQDFLGNALSFLNDTFQLGWNYAPDQCTLPPDKIVVPDDENELRLNIDDSISLLPPNQECVFVVNADNNGTYENGLEQDLFMGVWYSYNSSPIDKFNFYIMNDFSDLSKKGNNKQYIKVSVPYELISFNDLSLMRQSLAENYGTTANTIGELLQQGINYLFSGVGNLIVSAPEGLTASGVITNVGLDCNFSRPIDPTYIQGMVFLKLKGIKTINKQDMVILHSDLNVVEPKDLIEFMNYKNYSVPKENTTYEIYVSNMLKIMHGEIISPLVIDVPLNETKYSNKGLDSNSGFASLPERLKFYFISDLFYNNELTSIRYVVPITITALITGKYFDYFGVLGGLIDNPAKWLIQNWFLIGLFLFLILLISVIYRNFKGT